MIQLTTQKRGENFSFNLKLLNFILFYFLTSFWKISIIKLIYNKKHQKVFFCFFFVWKLSNTMFPIFRIFLYFSQLILHNNFLSHIYSWYYFYIHIFSPQNCVSLAFYNTYACAFIIAFIIENFIYLYMYFCKKVAPCFGRTMYVELNETNYVRNNSTEKTAINIIIVN